jgi:hypothetical protein
MLTQAALIATTFSIADAAGQQIVPQIAGSLA